jgi:hypothetical protein
MTEVLLETLMERLLRRLGLNKEELEEETVLFLQDELEAAEQEVLLYLGTDTLESRFTGQVVTLAALFYQRDMAGLEDSLKSYSYTEGQVSESSTYLSESEYRSGVAEVLDALARYRTVSC